MDVAQAAFNVFHDGEGGTAAIAALLGKRPGTIEAEIKPPAGSYAKLGLLDALKVTKWRRDYRILYAFADECGHVCFPAPASPATDGSTREVLAKASSLSRAFAESLGVMNETLSDGKVTPIELAKFEAEALTAVASYADVVRAMRNHMEVDLAHHQALVEEARRGLK